MTTEQLQSKIARCDAEIAACLTSSPDEPLSEKIGRMQGELDWTVAREMYREELRSVLQHAKDK